MDSIIVSIAEISKSSINVASNARNYMSSDEGQENRLKES